MTTRARQSPSSNRGSCPPWCVADHGSQQHEADQWHEGAAVEVPVTESVGRFSGSGWHLEEVGSTLLVVLEQHLKAAEPTVAFGPGYERSRNHRLSPESTRRLVRALQQSLAALEP